MRCTNDSRVARAARHPRRSAIPRCVITDLATEAMTPTQTTTHGLLAPHKRLEAQQIKTLVPQETDMSSRPSPPPTTNRPAQPAPSDARCRATTTPTVSRRRLDPRPTPPRTTNRSSGRYATRAERSLLPFDRRASPVAPSSRPLWTSCGRLLRTGTVARSHADPGVSRGPRPQVHRLSKPRGHEGDRRQAIP